MKIIKVDEKWSVRSDPENNDRPIAWLRYGVESHPFDHDNPVTAMFYAMLDDHANLAKAMEALQAADLYIHDLETHEGAEGFSVSTAEASKIYHAALAELEGEPLGAEFEAVWDANKGELYQS